VPDLITLTGIGKSFGPVDALQDITLHVTVGQVHALLGPNGSGKSTLTKLLSGRLHPTQGTVRVLGLDPREEMKTLNRRVGILYENHPLPGWATARDLLRFAAKAKGLSHPAEEAEKAARAFGVDRFWTRKIGTYSAGMHQRTSLAQAFLGDPEVFILDEPTSSLDVEATRIFSGWMLEQQERGKTILLTTHTAEALQSVTHLTVLMSGRIVASGPAAELAHEHHAYSTFLKPERLIETVEALRTLGIERVTLNQAQIEVSRSMSELQPALTKLDNMGMRYEVLGERIDYWITYGRILQSSSSQ